MTALYLTTIYLLTCALAVMLWAFNCQTARLHRAEGAHAETEGRLYVARERLYIAGLVNDTLVEDLRIAWGQPADDDIDQAIELANSPRYESIAALIAANEAARFDADDVDWGQR